MIFEGALTHYYRFTPEPTKQKIEKSEDQGNLIGFDDLLLTFMFYMAGNLLAFFVFLIEIIWAKISKMISQRRNGNRVEFFQRNP
jgi:flagellar biosynthesis protein FlhB